MRTVFSVLDSTEAEPTVLYRVLTGIGFIGAGFGGHPYLIVLLLPGFIPTSIQFSILHCHLDKSGNIKKEKTVLFDDPGINKHGL